MVCFGNWLLSASMGRVGREGLPTLDTKAVPQPWDCPQNGARNLPPRRPARLPAPRPGRQKEV